MMNVQFKCSAMNVPLYIFLQTCLDIVTRIILLHIRTSHVPTLELCNDRVPMCVVYTCHSWRYNVNHGFSTLSWLFASIFHLENMVQNAWGHNKPHVIIDQITFVLIYCKMGYPQAPHSWNGLSTTLSFPLPFTLIQYHNGGKLSLILID